MKFVCPWEYEVGLVGDGGMCVSDTWFQGRYDILRDESDNPIVVNDHVVLRKSNWDPDDGPPINMIAMKDAGRWRWVVSPTLHADQLYGQCATSNEMGIINV